MIGKGVFALAIAAALSALVLASAWAWKIANPATVIQSATTETEERATVPPNWPVPQPGSIEADEGVVTTNFVLFREKMVQLGSRKLEVNTGHHFDTEDQATFSHAWCYTTFRSGGVNIELSLGNKRPGERPVALPVSATEREKSGLSTQDTQLLFENCQWLDGNPNIQAQTGGNAFLFDDVVNEASINRLVAAINSGAKRVELASPGGEIGEALRGFEALQAAGVQTVATGQCASACTLLFLAGSERTVDFEGAIGVHQWSTDAGFTSDADAQFTSALLLELFSNSGVSEDFYIAGARTPSDAMRWLIRAELRDWGVVKS